MDSDVFIGPGYKVQVQELSKGRHKCQEYEKIVILPGFWGRDFNPGRGEKAWFYPEDWRKSGEGATIVKTRGGG